MSSRFVIKKTTSVRHSFCCRDSNSGLLYCPCNKLCVYLHRLRRNKQGAKRSNFFTPRWHGWHRQHSMTRSEFFFLRSFVFWSPDAVLLAMMAVGMDSEVLSKFAAISRHLMHPRFAPGFVEGHRTARQHCLVTMSWIILCCAGWVHLWPGCVRAFLGRLGCEIWPRHLRLQAAEMFRQTLFPLLV